MAPVPARLPGWRASLEESGTPLTFVYSFIRFPFVGLFRWPIQARCRIRNPIPAQVKPFEPSHPPAAVQGRTEPVGADGRDGVGMRWLAPAAGPAPASPESLR